MSDGLAIDVVVLEILVTNCQAQMLPLMNLNNTGIPGTERNHKPLTKPVSCALTMTRFAAKYDGGWGSKNKVLWLQTSRILREKYLWASSKGVQNHLSRIEAFELEDKVKAVLEHTLYRSALPKVSRMKDKVLVFSIQPVQDEDFWSVPFSFK